MTRAVGKLKVCCTSAPQGRMSSHCDRCAHSCASTHCASNRQEEGGCRRSRALLPHAGYAALECARQTRPFGQPRIEGLAEEKGCSIVEVVLVGDHGARPCLAKGPGETTTIVLEAALGRSALASGQDNHGPL